MTKVLGLIIGFMLGNEAHKLNGNTAEIIRVYKEKVRTHKTVYTEDVSVEDYFDDDYDVIEISCWYLEDVKVKLFRGNFDDGYQYDLRGAGYGRPKAWRVPFLESPHFDDVNWTVSHLCHDSKCYRWSHHVFETLEVNKGRNGCPGGNHCHHVTRCIRPGRFYNS